MSVTARIDDIAIPLVYSQELTIEIAGEEARTATGALRRNVFAMKREWRLGTRPMTKQAKDTLLSHLEGVLFLPVDFWLDEFGAETNTIRAFIEVNEERSIDAADRYSLVLTVEEE